MAFSQFLRLRRLCSDDSDFSEKSGAMSFLKILNYSKTIQRLALSFRNPHLFHSNVTKT